MAVALVSVLVGSMLENLSSVLLKEAGLARGQQTDLESILNTLQAVLHDEEKKQLKSEAVRNWLTKLKAAAMMQRILDAIAKERQFRLIAGGWDIEADSSDGHQTWSLVDESEIYGRAQEKEELMKSLANNSGDLSIYAICGMGILILQSGYASLMIPL
ncbi:hypothetical protein NC653_011017 [Populus alba x Populus x berolinensis]|uniref:Disease resistance N-terminal domain-containing protein n=2 Tax=Populus TaxID=3689 RepID=A0A4U5NMW2_POPAL|nr:hypothetical protein NC653_010050 [Populus alba x Populus x berolinensis]KAJ7000397.1 hypothetical protein NC653_011012 [Populus alba x Populus x berolinensis]KAJ7000402.1 hypothetical protein NC653_011017 [Populus alba x Populus x berolinensis]TKR84274.1 hypothetical protein D5086_0000259410 [Populus alba]